MREQLYKIFDLLLNTSKNDKTIGFCYCFFGIVFFLIHFIFGKDCDPLLIIIPAIPTLFFIVWFILALIVLSRFDVRHLQVLPRMGNGVDERVHVNR